MSSSQSPSAPAHGAGRRPRGAARGRILDATLRLVGERGLHALTMRDVATAAGVSLGATSYHFTDRDALLRAALERFAEEEIGRCEAAVAALARDVASPSSSPEDPDALLDALVGEIARTYARPGATVAQLELYVAASRDPALAAIAMRCRDAYVALARQALGAAGLPDDAARARALIALADGHALHAAAAGAPTTTDPGLADALRALALGRA